MASTTMWHPHYHGDYFRRSYFLLINDMYMSSHKTIFIQIYFFFFFNILLNSFSDLRSQFSQIKNKKIDLLTFSKLLGLYDKYWSCHVVDWGKKKQMSFLLYSFSSWLLLIYIIFFFNHKTFLEEERCIWIWIP